MRSQHGRAISALTVNPGLGLARLVSLLWPPLLSRRPGSAFAGGSFDDLPRALHSRRLRIPAIVCSPIYDPAVYLDVMNRGHLTLSSTHIRSMK